ncbi:tetratricopeptide repeat-containing serine protease family protein [Nitrosospira multiformis]|uniref:TPR repeat n=1 Tax=Nitrosospira multiformis TaxID=1231 RepID=A0A1I7HAN4_9PROT|nr:tetratricopeptide repeat-containing serine protease family protein [Nitrosospira multiformis]SFU57770.1 TPR repeat [Nitrosospira multiformis]
MLTGKSDRTIFALLTVTLFLLLNGCDQRDAKVTSTTAGPVIEQRPEDKFAKKKKEAEQGNAAAQRDLGSMYHHGEGVLQDEAKAIEWYQKAAEQGDAEAQYHLGEMYYNDNPFGDQLADAAVHKDSNQAFFWYQKAAEQGNAAAQFELGLMYHNRNSSGRPVYSVVPEDNVKAVEWYRKAAEQGLPTAQRYLALMYKYGEGVAKDISQAVHWLQKAAEQGDGDAQVFLGMMYGDGDGVPKDLAKAVEWNQKAAAQGNRGGQMGLFSAYFNGEGVSRNRILGYAWLILSASTEPTSLVNIYENRMTPAEVAEGQRLASTWKMGTLLQPVNALVAGDMESAGTLAKHETGTAFVVSYEGHAVTNQHVINACKEVRVVGQEGAVKVITSDIVNDLALLQFPSKSARIASLSSDSANLRQGEDLVVFGYPLNSILSAGGNLTPGTLSALTGLGNNTNQLQITAPIQPGSSGSPVLDRKGNVIGMVSMKLDDGFAAKTTSQIPQTVNFAVNGQTVKAFLEVSRVPYKTGGGFFSTKKSNVDIAEEARKWTAIIECWK